jgi:hypothetical protein
MENDKEIQEPLVDTQSNPSDEILLHGDAHPGWPDGSCCCNCESWLPLHKHPWNKGDGKGLSTESMGHVCLLQIDNTKKATFYDSTLEHGFCELHTPNEKRRKYLWLEAKGKEYGI